MPPPQNVSPRAPHVVSMQTPSTHRGLAKPIVVQSFPHEPQRSTSVRRLRQVPAQSVSSGRQVHAAPAQYSRSPQKKLPAVPSLHPPQLYGSVFGSEHMSPMATLAQTVALHEHAPATQVKPRPQPMPQPPQLNGSVEVSVHTPPHIARGAGQTHVPEMHSSPALQAWPHPAQLAGSLEVSAQ